MIVIRCLISAVAGLLSLGFAFVWWGELLMGNFIDAFAGLVLCWFFFILAAGVMGVEPETED